MNFSEHQTWDQALLRRVRAGGYRRRRAALLTAALVVGLVVGLLPGVAQAHLDEPGYNGAQIEMSDNEIDFAFMPRGKAVKGKNFNPNDLAQIYQCPAGETDLDNECLRVGTAPTDSDGGFSAQVVVNSTFVSPSGKTTVCKAYPGWTEQCSVAAATYEPISRDVTSMAEHYLCFQGGPCTVNRDGTPTTTTTVPPAPHEWEPAATMNVARQGLATAVDADGRIYALGGHQADGVGISSAERYDPCGGKTWSPIAPMPTPRTQFAAAGGPDGRIYAIGGREQRFGTPLATVDAYDPVTNTWSAVARLAVPRSDLTAATGSDGRIYAIGGMIGVGRTGGEAVSTVEAYNTSTNEWQLVAPLTRPRGYSGAAIGPGGRIYVLGGTDNLTTQWVPAPVEHYSPGPAGTPGVWQPTRAIRKLPALLAVTAGPDGLIYAVGGEQTSGSSRTMTVYDPIADTFTASTEALTTPRLWHGAATGRDGRIYAIGGTEDYFALGGPFPLSSTESMKIAPSLCPPPAADFDGDRTTDYSVFRPSTGTWFVKDGLTLNYGADGDIPVPGDYDGDLKTDVAVFRPSNGVWFVRNSTGGDTALAYGTSGDVPVPADYDGDEKADIAVFRPSSGVWFIRYSAGGDAAVAWGTSGDVAVPGDYDGDKKADVAVFRAGTWFIRPASGAPDITVNYGTSGDIPVVGDYDADTTADIAVFRPSNGFWFLLHSSDGTQEAVHFGTSGDVPVPGDYNGDAIADPAVFRPSSGVWFVETGVSAPWGTDTDIPLPLPAAVRMAFFAGAS